MMTWEQWNKGTLGQGTMRQGHNRTGEQWDKGTMGQGNDGTRAQWDRGTMGQGHNWTVAYRDDPRALILSTVDVCM